MLTRQWVNAPRLKRALPASIQCTPFPADGSNQALVTDVNCSTPALGIIFHGFEPTSQGIRMAAPAVARSQLLRRRSTRIRLNTAIGVSGEDRAKSSFSLSAKAINLSKHGAAIQLNRQLLIGTKVLVRNKRGSQICARIVTEISAAQGGQHTYGIEFVEQDENNFWGITFPATTLA